MRRKTLKKLIRLTDYELEGLVEGLRTKDLQQTKYYYNLLMKYVNKYGPDARSYSDI